MPTVTDTVAFCPDCERLYCDACSPRGAACAGCDLRLCPDCAAEAFGERKGLCSFCGVPAKTDDSDLPTRGVVGHSWPAPGDDDGSLLAEVHEAQAKKRAYARERAVGQAMRRAKKVP